MSLLLDGELPRAEGPSVEAHLAGCAECRAARGEFLFFREQLGSYRAESDTAAQRRALEAALGAGQGVGAARRRGRLAAGGLSPLRPATAFAFALALVALVGLAAYLSRRPDAPQVVQAPATDSGKPATTAASPAPPPSPMAPDNPTPERRTVRSGGARKRQAAARPVMPAVARAKRPPADAGRPATAGGEAVEAAAAESASRRELPRAGLDPSRHVEQAQLLLRSFRNARAGDDLAFERERSGRLLYRNIVLRREAARQNDPVLTSVLGRLEPILLDIANLPARPAVEEVASIRERVRKQNLVVALQAGVGKR